MTTAVLERPTAGKTKAPRPRASKVSAAEADFIRGRDLALAMLEVAAEMQDDISAVPGHQRRHYRDGKAQVRFTESFLLSLVADPSMLDGFNAVLSAKLSSETDCYAWSYRQSMAEYSEGALGADGTWIDPNFTSPQQTSGDCA